MKGYSPTEKAEAQARRGLQLLTNGVSDGSVIFEAALANVAAPSLLRATELVRQMTALNDQLGLVLATHIEMVVSGSAD
jgi:hypothetical protein